MDALAQYFDEINATPLLTGLEEQDLGRRIQQGDQAALDHLVRANLRLVANLARACLGRGLHYQDLIAEGNLGLIRAAQAFDPERGTRFSTYASHWIKQAIRRGIANTAHSIRLPSYALTLVNRWHAAHRHLSRQLGRRPEPDEVAAFLELRPKTAKVAQQAVRHASAMVTQQSAADYLNEVEARASNLPTGEEREQLAAAVAGLPERERAVIAGRYGLDGQQPETLERLGQRLGLTKERVRQLQVQALGLLRAQLEAV